MFIWLFNIMQYLIGIVALVVVVVVQVTQLQLQLGTAKGFVSSLTCGLICRAIKFLDISFMFIYSPHPAPTPSQPLHSIICMICSFFCYCSVYSLYPACESCESGVLRSRKQLK